MSTPATRSNRPRTMPLQGRRSIPARLFRFRHGCGGPRRATSLHACIILLATLLALPALPDTSSWAAAAPPLGEARVSFVEAFRRNDDIGSPFVTAVGVRWTPAEVAAAPARVVVLIDTSASQIGDHRRRRRPCPGRC